MDTEQEAALVAEVKAWAAQKHISMDTTNAIIEMGFNSLSALACISAEDFKGKSNIPVGQKKLVLKAAGEMGSVSTTPTPPAAGGDSGRSEPPPQSVPQGTTSTSNDHTSSDGFAATLRQHLDAGMARLGPSTLAAVDPHGGGTGLTGPRGAITGNLSWQDPQIFLKSASGVSKTSCYNIVDFVDNHNIQSEKILSTGDEFELVCRSGSRKPRLENLTISQWSLANLAILYRLVEDGSLNSSEVLDYLSHTSQIYSLISSHELVSVYQYDREYRRLQATHNFRWGTNVGHLAPGFLRIRSPIVSNNKPKPTPRVERSFTRPNSFQSHTGDGKTICRSFNSRLGCSFKGCKFEHVCNVPGCGKSHPGVNHSDQKN
jgi:hypothetical protein